MSYAGELCRGAVMQNGLSVGVNQEVNDGLPGLRMLCGDV